MESRLLIDAVVRQTTLLIAQLATSTGIRAPLSHVADQIFLELAAEIEDQGVTRKVVADMFGMALRTYQKKVNRLRESVTHTEQTLWQATLEHVRRTGSVSRAQALEAFKRDEPRDVVAVLNDLVAGGLLYATGRGQHAVYGATNREDQETLSHAQGHEAFVHMVWLAIAQGEISRAELDARFPDDGERMDDGLRALVDDGRVQATGLGATVRLRASRVLIPVGSEVGWEAAVLDHFRAVCTALANKLRHGGAGAGERADLIGGTTLSFDVYPGHPFEVEVKALLAHKRGEVLELWKRVADHNEAHPVLESQREKVVFYLGQNWIEANGDEPAD